MTEESRGRPARKYPPRIDATPEELARVVLNGGRPKGSVKALEIWPESHWPGFALRQSDVFQS